MSVRNVFETLIPRQNALLNLSSAQQIGIPDWVDWVQNPNIKTVLDVLSIEEISGLLNGFDFTNPEAVAVALNALDQAAEGVRNLLGSVLNTFDLEFVFPIEGLNESIQISRESSGLTHIQAVNDADVFFGLGLVHAIDRLWQMDFQRRIVAGRQSEILGEDTLDQDILLRTIGLYRAAESAYQNLSLETKQVVDAYTNGINSFLELDLPLPFEFQLLDYEPEPWRPADVLAAVKLRSFDLSANFERELFRAELLNQGIPFERIISLFPLSDDAVTILQPEDLAALPLPLANGLSAPRQFADAIADNESPASGLGVDLSAIQSLQAISRALFPSAQASNNWVISGDRTTTGKPFLANDPHLPMQIPSIWHTVHLESPSLNVIGASIPGTPGIAIGRNEHIAWGVTTSLVDVQDLYLLQGIPDSELDIEVRQETIAVRGAEAVVIPVRESLLGPIISDALARDPSAADFPPLALRWVSLDDEDGTLEAFLEVNQASNWTEFTSALESYVAPSQNFVYADVEGNIGYISPGKIPIRPTVLGNPFTLNGLVPVDVNSLLAADPALSDPAQLDWESFIPFELLPQTFNPERGYIITANHRIAPDEYPFLLGFDYAQPYRARRIQELIEAKPTLSLEDMQAIQLDQVSLLASDFKPVLRDIKPLLKSVDPQPTEAIRWVDRLLHWDGDTSPSSRQATVFQKWYNELAKIPARAIGRDFLTGNLIEPTPQFLLTAFEQGDPACGGASTACLETAAQLFQEVVTSFDGSVPAWGEIHQATFNHPAFPLNRQVPFGGDRYTINIGSYDPETLLFDANGATYRQIIDLAELDNSVFIQTPGQSGRLLSPFFDNLLPPWQAGDYLPLQTDDFQSSIQITLNPNR